MCAGSVDLDAINMIIISKRTLHDRRPRPGTQLPNGRAGAASFARIPAIMGLDDINMVLQGLGDGRL
jgi:hypothetical protein